MKSNRIADTKCTGSRVIVLDFAVTCAHVIVGFALVHEAYHPLCSPWSRHTPTLVSLYAPLGTAIRESSTPQYEHRYTRQRTATGTGIRRYALPKSKQNTTLYSLYGESLWFGQTWSIVVRPVHLSV